MADSKRLRFELTPTGFYQSGEVTLDRKETMFEVAKKNATFRRINFFGHYTAQI